MTRVQHSKEQLALRVVGEHFGATVQSIARIIADSEFATLSHIYQTAKATLQLCVNNATGNSFFVNPAHRNAGTGASRNAYVPIKKDSSTLSAAKVGAIEAQVVRQAVLTLLYHFCVVAELPADVPTGDVTEAKSEAATTSSDDFTLLYRLHIDNIISRLRFPRLLEIVRKKYDGADGKCKQRSSIAAHILETVMLRGRCKEGSILAVMQEQAAADGNAAAASREQIKSIFDDLVRDRYLIVCAAFTTQRRIAAVKETGRMGKQLESAFTSSISKSAVGNGSALLGTKTNGARGGNATRGRGVKRSAEEQVAQLQAEALRARNTVKRSRVSNAISAGAPYRSTVDSSASIDLGRSSGSLPVELMHLTGHPTKSSDGRSSITVSTMDALQDSRIGTAVRSTKDAPEAEFEPCMRDNGKEVTALSSSGLWIIGWDQLIRDERHLSCIELVEQQHKSTAGAIVRAVLCKSMPLERSTCQSKSAEVKVVHIHEFLLNEHKQQLEVHKKSLSTTLNEFGSVPEPAVDINTVKKLLEYLRLSSDNSIVKVVGSELEEGGPSYMVNIESLIGNLRRRTVRQIAWERFGPASARIIELLHRYKYLEQQEVSDLAILPARETQERLYRLYLDKWVDYVELSKRNDYNPVFSMYYWFMDPAKLKANLLEHMYFAANNLMIRRAHEYEKNGPFIEFNRENESETFLRDNHQRRVDVLDTALQNLHRSIMILEYF